MSDVLLSIVVPTKNRVEYLKALIEIFCGFRRNDLELVIEDNSDDNTEIVNYIRTIKDKKIIYNYEKRLLSVVENSDRAILHSSGKYVCFIGDDDLLSESVGEFVECMDKYGYESAMFQVAKYYWPGIEFRTHKFPNLVINDFTGEIKEISVKQELYKILMHGASSLEMAPKVYHGIVRRSCLDQIFDKTGTFFPGPSPDMANAVALSLIVKKHIYCDVPFISAGASPKSAAGLGTKHKHEGNLKDMSFLPNDVEEKWNLRIPKVWTGPTIYAQSASSALKEMGREDLLVYFDYNYHYAYFVTFCPNYKTFFYNSFRDVDCFSKGKYNLSLIKVFCIRVHKFLQNIKLTKFHMGGLLKTDISTSIEAEEVIDKMVNKIKIEELFQKICSDDN